MDRNAKIGAVATAVRRTAPMVEPARPSRLVAAASGEPLRVGVLVDLEYTPAAGGHVKCWQRLAEAAVEIPDELDLTVHFNGPERRELPLSPTVRYALLPPVFSTARLMRNPHLPDHTDLAPWHPQLARALPRYEVIHTTDAFFCYARTAVRFARTRGVPVVSSIHTNTPEYARITVGKMMQRRLGTGLAYRVASDYLGVPNWVGLFLERRLKKHLASVTAVVGSFVGDPGLSNTRGHHEIVIRRGLDRWLFSPARRDRAWFERRFGLRRGELIAVYAGKLNAGKNVPLLAPIIQAARARGVAVHLFCAGEGAESSQLQAALGPASTFAGLLTQDELARVYASADLFLFPSEIDEFGSAAQEALACGLPVLAARGSGFASSMVDCLAVRVLPGDDPEPWAAAIADLAAAPHRRRAMGQAGRAYVEARVPSWSEVLEQDLLPVWREAAWARQAVGR
ncbi:MAG TPA: glycosyltransferase [Stellaceae bacterium]|nr:glycosyltransferase [Stellaceae bacterium]